MPDTDRLSERLRAAAEPDWSALAEHPFVRALAAGTLEAERFRFYLEQNLQYLPRYARVMALGAARAREPRELELFRRALEQVTEVEIPENRALLERVCELGAAERGGAAEPAPANLAYTSFLLATAFDGGTPEILAAVLPCTWSYGVIGQRLAPDAAEHPVYREWISFFAGDAYRAVVDGMRADLDELAGAVDDAAFARLQRIFHTAVRLERGFWDMADAMAVWPAVAAGR